MPWPPAVSRTERPRQRESQLTPKRLRLVAQGVTVTAVVVDGAVRYRWVCDHCPSREDQDGPRHGGAFARPYDAWGRAAQHVRSVTHRRSSEAATGRRAVRGIHGPPDGLPGGPPGGHGRVAAAASNK